MSILIIWHNFEPNQQIFYAFGQNIEQMILPTNHTDGIILLHKGGRDLHGAGETEPRLRRHFRRFQSRNLDRRIPCRKVPQRRVRHPERRRYIGHRGRAHRRPGSRVSRVQEVLDPSLLLQGETSIGTKEHFNWAVSVAHSTPQLLPLIEDLGSNPIFSNFRGKILFAVFCCLSHWKMSSNYP